ncbi:hypothetical protein D9M68_982760 [compost metagenome]
MTFQRQAALQNGLGLQQQLLARGGQCRDTRGAVEQLDAKVRFQVGDGGADGGLRAPEPARRCREGACLRNGDQNLQLIQ